ncbi:hypothetical protein ACFR9U_19745 [Halorientalis brevis]|uniref:MBL fold metallo-hydrolase n=1 Tax=Halorientalis brevis TaxID=1126241 RepID=A0ABD6CFY2_9EURY|nr:hypothetical protein [Halorientalis brevis]
MPAYERSPASSSRAIDRWDSGVGWLAHPDEDGRRASHAVEADDGVWLLDPLDVPRLDDLLAEFGDVAGVAVLSSYHARDAGAIARRHDVAVHVPHWLGRVPERVDAPVERFNTEPGDSGFSVRRCEPIPGWEEAIAYRERDGTLYVPDLLGTAPGYAVGDERLGVFLTHRLFPPREALGDLSPERILFGHGEGILDEAAAALDDALAGARRRFPRALVTTLGTNVRLLLGAMGE